MVCLAHLSSSDESSETKNGLSSSSSESETRSPSLSHTVTACDRRGKKTQEGKVYDEIEKLTVRSNNREGARHVWKSRRSSS